MAQKSKFQYFIAKQNQKKDFARKVLDNHLYVDGWCFENYLCKMIYENDTSFEICLCQCDNLPIGCSIITSDGLTGFFVAESYRRMGIATKLCAIMRSYIQDNVYLYAGHGIDGSEKFFDWVGLNLDYNK